MTLLPSRSFSRTCLFHCTPTSSLVPIDSDRLVDARITVVRIVAFARDQFTPSIAIQMRQGHSVCLRPAIINQTLRPHATPPGILFLHTRRWRGREPG